MQDPLAFEIRFSLGYGMAAGAVSIVRSRGMRMTERIPELFGGGIVSPGSSMSISGFSRCWGFLFLRERRGEYVFRCPAEGIAYLGFTVAHPGAEFPTHKVHISTVSPPALVLLSTNCTERCSCLTVAIG